MCGPKSMDRCCTVPILAWARCRGMHDGLSGIGVVHHQQIKRHVIEGNKRLEDESIDMRAINQ